MNKEQVFKKLNSIFIEVFKNNALIIKPYTTSKDIPEWDSFSNIELILNIENEFNVKFDLKELRDAEDVGKIVEYILEKKA